MSTAITLLLVLGSTVIAEGTQPSGSGTSEDPYLVSTLDHLRWITTNDSTWGATFKQTANIDASVTQYWDDSNDDASGGLYDDTNDGTSSGNNEGFPPIGNNSTRFTGSYNGQEYTISNLKISRSGSDYIGFFGYTNGATISNLGMTSVSITGQWAVGGLVAYHALASTITNCYSTGSVTGSWAYHGGLVGISENNNTYITDCYSTVTVSGTDDTGGLVGRNASSAVINRCYASGTVTGDEEVGGLVGDISSASVNDCYATGSVSGTNYIGGLAGLNGSGGYIRRSYATGSVGNTGTRGGLVAFNHASAGGVLSSFWDNQTSYATSAAGTGKTTAVMKTLATFTETDTEGLDEAWDFETNPNDDALDNNYWDMDLSGTINSGYPYLSWQDGAEKSLPVDLSTFTASVQSDGVLLEWTTESEIDNLGFILERKIAVESASGDDWSEIASYERNSELAGHGSTPERQHYQYLDRSVKANVEYEYRIADVDYNGAITWFGAVSIDAGDAILPSKIVLHGAFPNPFNPSTLISYSLEDEARVTLFYYDITGRLVDKQGPLLQSDGYQEMIWEGTDQNGQSLDAGIYFCRLVSSGDAATIKLLLMK